MLSEEMFKEIKEITDKRNIGISDYIREQLSGSLAVEKIEKNNNKKDIAT
jgi:hypothetical protein